MADKNAALSKEEEQELSQLYASSLNLASSKSKDLLKKPAQAHLLADIIRSHGLGSQEAGPSSAGGKFDGKVGTLLVTAVTSPLKLDDEKRKYVVTRVLDGSLKSTDQVNAASKFLESKDLPVDQAEFDEESGVGECYGPGKRLKRMRFKTKKHVL